MNYNFLKENIYSLINGVQVDISAIEMLITDRDNSFILKHNIEAVSELIKFLKGSDNIFVLNGFMGSGKTACVDLVEDFIDENVLIFNNAYEESVNLDDIFLSMFRDFSNYQNEKKVILPKVNTNIFSDKINAYIKYCNSAMLFIFDGFEINMQSAEKRKDILNFINYLSHFEKIKIIITSRTFKSYELINSTGVNEYTLKSLTEDEAEQFIKLNDISGNSYEISEIYKQTRGYYVLLAKSIFIMKLYDLNTVLFMNEYKKSGKNFTEFIISKLLDSSSVKFVKPLLFLALIRHRVSIDYIIMHDIATLEELEFLTQKQIVSQNNGKYFIKDYIKSQYLNTVNELSKIKACEYLIKLYDAELPLKPFERGLFLSRQTMREEISYNKERIKKFTDKLESSKKTKNSQSDINYVSYSVSSGYDESAEKQTKENYLRRLKRKNIKKSGLTNEEYRLINSINKEDIISQSMLEISQTKHKENSETVITSDVMEEIPNTLQDYIKIAQDYETVYNYTNAILYYKQALTYRNDENYTKLEPFIYEKLAQCYKKIQNIDEAVKMFENAYKIYINQSPENAYNVLDKMAKMYTEAFKFEQAKDVYKRIINSPIGIEKEKLIRVYLNLAEIENNDGNIHQALTYSQLALCEAEKISNTKLLSECYFKFGLVLDDTNNVDFAVRYYLRCIQTSNNPKENIYLASAYSNLAGISYEKNNISASKMYYELSINADKELDNNEGLYYSYIKLARIYAEENNEKTHEYLLNALSYAKKCDDITYTISTYSEIGDYNFEKENYKQALKSYIIAMTLVPAYLDDDIKPKLNKKISQIKSAIGEFDFKNLIDEIKKKN